MIVENYPNFNSILSTVIFRDECKDKPCHCACKTLRNAPPIVKCVKKNQCKCTSTVIRWFHKCGAECETRDVGHRCAESARTAGASGPEAVER